MGSSYPCSLYLPPARRWHPCDLRPRSLGELGHRRLLRKDLPILSLLVVKCKTLGQSRVLNVLLSMISSFFFFLLTNVVVQDWGGPRDHHCRRHRYIR